MSWIKRNAVLVSGIALPVVLVLTFLALETVPRALAEPPAYDFVLVAYCYTHHHGEPDVIDFHVRDGRIVAEVEAPVPVRHDLHTRHPRLLRYRVDSERFEPIGIETPSPVDDDSETTTWMVSETRGFQLATAPRSPDGFELEYAGYRGHGGLLGGLFGMGQRRDAPWVLSRDGLRHELPAFEGAGCRPMEPEARLLAWIVAEQRS